MTTDYTFAQNCYRVQLKTGFDVVAAIAPVADPPKPSGLVLTQVKSKGNHVQYHPVFKLSKSPTGTPKSNDSKMLEDGKDGVNALCGMTSVWHHYRLNPTYYKSVNTVTGFLGVCVSNTRLVDDDFIGGNVRAIKRRKREDPRMTLAVAGTVTMPFFKGAVGDDTDGSVVKPGDLVAFAAVAAYPGFKPTDVRVLAGTESKLSPEFVPRIRKFKETDCNVLKDNVFKDNCTAPFGVCTAIDEEAGQITVLLRMDLYHSYFYNDAVYHTV